MKQAKSPKLWHKFIWARAMRRDVRRLAAQAMKLR